MLNGLPKSDIKINLQRDIKKWVPVSSTGKISELCKRFGVQSSSTSKTDRCLGLMIRAIIRSRRHKLKFSQKKKKKKKKTKRH